MPKHTQKEATHAELKAQRDSLATAVHQYHKDGFWLICNTCNDRVQDTPQAQANHTLSNRHQIALERLAAHRANLEGKPAPKGREPAKLTQKEAKANLAALGLTLTKKDAEYRVNLAGGLEASAYYTTDLADAVATGKKMHEQGAVVWPSSSFKNPADKYINRPGHWTMATKYPHHCVHCDKDYNAHNPWPELPCPKPDEINATVDRMNQTDAALPHLRLEGELTPRECATVLHGLRLIQCQGRIEGCAAGDCEHFEDYEALTDGEIDTLAERINLGPIQPTLSPDVRLRHLIARARRTMDGDSNDAEHDALVNLIEYLTTTPKAQPPKTPPNAEPFLWLQEDEDQADADCGCILEAQGPDDQPGAAFFMCETHEAAPNLKHHLSAALDTLGQLAEYLKESHGIEIEDGHGGDGPEGCSYCEAIIDADMVAREALNLPPRPTRLCENCQTERPIVEDRTGAHCLICDSREVAKAS